MKMHRLGVGLAYLLASFLFTSIHSDAQDRTSPPRQRHRPSYRFFDLGTFGGPNSSTNGGTVVISPGGIVVGGADTDTPCGYFPAFPISPGFKSHGQQLHALPTLPDGCTGFPIAISTGASIVGSADTGILDALGIPTIRAVLWRDRHIVDLGTLGGDNSLAVAINSRQQIVGMSANSIPDPFSMFGFQTQTRGFIWEKGAMHDLGTLGGPDSMVGLINERGQIAGVSYINDIPNPMATFCGENIPPQDPFIWQDGKMTDLGSLGGTCGVAAVLNQAGQVVGFSGLPGDQTGHPFLWSDGKMRDLGTVGGTFGIAGWINDAGQVIGASTTENDLALRGFLWQKGVMRNLGTLAGDTCSDAFEINAKGQVVGPSFDCNAPDDTHAYLWESGEMFDLNAFVPSNVSVQLADPHFINDRGEITVVGVLPDGNQHTVLLVPCRERGDKECREAANGRQPVRRQKNAHLTAQAGRPTHFDSKALAAIVAKRSRVHALRRPGQQNP